VILVINEGDTFSLGTSPLNLIPLILTEISFNPDFVGVNEIVYLPLAFPLLN